MSPNVQDEPHGAPRAGNSPGQSRFKDFIGQSFIRREAIAFRDFDPKRQSQASPLRLLTAIVQPIGSAAEVRAAFQEAVVSIS